MVTYNGAMDDELVFKALADPTRRHLLDVLFERGGRTLKELESTVEEMSRFGVMKHLRVLEEAGLVIVRRSGREKLHYLNPVPIRLIHDRWISKYTERQVSALSDLKRELEEGTLMAASSTRVVQVYEVYIRATPQAIWDAITKPEWNRRYGYGVPSEYDLRPGGAFRALASDVMKAHGAPDVIIDGEVLEADPPRRLVQTYRSLWDPEMAKEGFTKVTWEIGDPFHGVTRLRVTHELDGAPKTAAQVAGELPGTGGGWSMILSDLKTLLETGTGLFAAAQ